MVTIYVKHSKEHPPPPLRQTRKVLCPWALFRKTRLIITFLCPNWLLCSFFRMYQVVNDMKVKRTCPPVTMTSWTNGHSSVTALINIRVACCNKETAGCVPAAMWEATSMYASFTYLYLINYQFTLSLVHRSLYFNLLKWIINEQQANLGRWLKYVTMYIADKLMVKVDSLVHAHGDSCPV